MDQIDKKILAALSENSRAPRSNLASKLRISKSTLLYRIAKLEKDKVFSYTTIIDHSNDNLMYVRLAIKGNLERSDYMTFYAKVHGMYDAVLSFYAATIIDAQEVIDTIRQNVESMHVSFAIHIFTSYPKAFGLNIEPVKSSFLQKNTLTNYTQTKLIESLEKNPQKNINELADSLSVSPKTLVHHKRELEQNGVIQKYSIAINSKSFGFEQAHIFWNGDYKDKNEFLGFLLTHERTVFVTLAFGDSVESEYLFESHKELFAFISEVKKRFSATTDSYFVYD